MSEDEIITCYRFVTESLYSQHGDIQWKIGEWMHQDGELKLCVNGLHASRDPVDSLKYIFGSRWFQAEARGDILEDDDKLCAPEMRLVKEIPIKVIHQWAVDCAYRVLHYYENKYPEDKRPRLALEATQRLIDGSADPIEKRAITEAARDARTVVWSIAEAADAAWVAGAAAASEAAEAASEAAWAAGIAAGAAAAEWAAGAARAARAADEAAGAARAAANAAELRWQRQRFKEIICRYISKATKDE